MLPLRNDICKDWFHYIFYILELLVFFLILHPTLVPFLKINPSLKEFFVWSYRGFKGAVAPLSFQMKKGSPISPDEIPAAKITIIPPEVFDAVNELLARKSTGKHSSITILQSEIVVEIKKRISTEFHNDWLNFEDAYRAAGWEVEYDRPAYCETYPASFMFKRRGHSVPP
jgi:hypothetical protein